LSYNTYEAVSAAFARLPVSYDDRLGDISKRFEVAAQGLVGRVVRQSADEDLGERRVAMV